MNIEPFTIDHYRAVVGDQNFNAANATGAIVNLISGPGYTLIERGHILAIGGVRVQGIGEAWMLLAPEGKDRPKSIIRAGRAVMDEAMKQERLYRVYAEATVDKPHFYEVLGFHQQGNLWVR